MPTRDPFVEAYFEQHRDFALLELSQQVNRTMTKSMESHEQIPEHRAATSRFSARAPLFTGGIIVFLFTLLFTLPWWNRYLGLTNQGWYQFFGMQSLKGHIPYRGFYLF